MARVFSDRSIVAIDVGTTKICVLVAERNCQDHITITGIGKAPSQGLKKGVVVNIGQTIHSIKQAIHEAELMSGNSITSAYIGISGGHIAYLNSHGAVPIKRGTVTASDIERALEAARAIPIADGQQILHVLPQYFVIDNQDQVIDPISMHGIRLEVVAHVITGSITGVQNLVSCCQQAGVQVQDIILEPLASAHAVLTRDEQELGAGILDIGGGTADFAVYQHGTIRHTHIISVAGNQFTRDIAIGLQTTISEAERIKREYAAAHKSYSDPNMILTIATMDNSSIQNVKQHHLIHVVHARAYELLSLLKHNIDTHKVNEYMSSGIVLTGGGALLKGLDTMAQEILNMPVRVGLPSIEYEAQILKNPMYATGYGLLLCALKKNVTPKSTDINLVSRVVSSMKSWVSDFF